MVFRDVVGEIGLPGAPIYLELLLVDSVPDPVEPHVDGLGALEFDVVVGDAAGGRVVDLNGSRWLGIAHFM